MNIKFKSTLTTLLALATAPLAFAEGVPGVSVDFVDYHFDSCEMNADGTDAEDMYMQCVNGACIAWFNLCGTRDDKAKYRVHFDTSEPYFDDDSNNEDCFTTTDDTAMYQPGTGKVTGPDPYLNDGGDWIQWIVTFDELGIEAGDYVAAWMDIHKQGIQDRVPDTDDADGCAKPQYSFEVLEVIANP
jgi:hypothetical protein